MKGGGWNRPAGDRPSRVDEDLGLVSGIAGFARDRFQWQAVPLFAIRVATIGAAAIALTWGVVGLSGVVAAVLGAVLGAIVGHASALSKARLPVLIVAAVLVGVLGGVVGHLAVGSVSLVRMLGPGLALDVAAIARFGGYAMSVAAVLRMLSVRIPSLVGAELVAVAMAVVIPLSPHREGVVARPLWLSDWAWHNGFDPAQVLLAIGGGVALILGGLLMARTGNRVSLISWLSLAALLVLGISVVDVDGLPKPKAGNDLGLTGDEIGDTPLPTDEGPWNGPGRTNNKPKDPGQDSGGGKSDGGDDGGKKPEQGDGGQGGQPKDPGQSGQGGQPKQPQGGQGGGQQKQDQKSAGGSGKKDGKDQGGKPPPREPNVEDQQGAGGSPAPMAVVLFGDDYLPPGGGFYFRQDVWSHFNGSRLVSGRRPDVDRDVLKTFPAAERSVAEPPGPEGRQSVTASVFLTVRHKRPFALESLVKMAPERNPDSKRFVRAFQFESLAQSVPFNELLGKTPGSAAWPEEVAGYYTVTPNDDRYAELAETIVSTLREDMQDDPFAQALAIKLWLDDNITYSTSERHAGAADPAADFLFGNQIGYCVHIAHAAVYLWRSRGIAARVGTGYMATPDAMKGSALIIRSSDAHAWPELYLDGMGWVVLDIAPKKTLDKPQPPSDDDLTEQLADIARAEGDDKAKPKADTQRDGQDGLGLRLQMLLALLGTLVVLYAIKIWRRLAPKWATMRGMPRVAYRRALDQLGEVGLTREFGETRASFARRVGQTVPSMAALAELSEAARLGNPDTAATARPELSRAAWKQALAGVSADLRNNVPLKRRLFGVLNPIVFWQVR
ncbi:MAG: transglutaminase-like domain-containing protein [Myxococcota bacterium]